MTVISLDQHRSNRRLSQFDDTIQHFIDVMTKAHQGACDTEDAKQRYLASLNPDLLPPAA